MKILRMRWILFCALSIAVFFPVSLPGLEVAKLDERISTLTDQFNELMGMRRTRIPGYVLQRAEGIVIIRDYHFAFFGGAKGGNGVALARDPATRAWSPPAFIRMGEGSFGFQFGLPLRPGDGGLVSLDGASSVASAFQSGCRRRLH